MNIGAPMFPTAKRSAASQKKFENHCSTSTCTSLLPLMLSCKYDQRICDPKNITMPCKNRFRPNVVGLKGNK